MRDSSGKSDVSTVTGAESGATDVELQFVIERWPALTPEVRAAVVSLVQAKGVDHV